MSGGIIIKNVHTLAIAVFSVLLMFSLDTYAASAKAPAAKPAAKAPAAKAAAPAAGKAASKAAPAATATATKSLTPPPIAGMQKVVAPDKAKILDPDKSKVAKKAKSYTETLEDAEKAKNPKKAVAKKQQKKLIKSRKIVVDAQIMGWGSKASVANNASLEQARKLVGTKKDFLVKDMYFGSDNGKYMAYTRINFDCLVPENWYLETQMVVGFSAGGTYERAYNDAMMQAAGMVKSIQNSSTWKAANNTSVSNTEMGLIPYSVVFSTSGKEYTCRLYFRYFAPRK